MKYLIPAFLFSLCIACNSRDSISEADTNMPVIADFIMNDNGDTVLQADFSKLNDYRIFYIDNLVDSIEIIQLDSENDSAVISKGITIVSDNYIGIYSQAENQYKLFARNGKFISNVGARGQGPAEYNFVYDAVIDEKNDRLYLMEFNATHIIEYDLSGNFIRRIPLPFTVPKGRMHIKDDKIHIVVLKWNHEDTPLMWVQDYEGNILYSIQSDITSVVPDFSNEISLTLTKDGDLSVCLLGLTNENNYLYHISDSGHVFPVFKLNFNNNNHTPPHNYAEYADYYAITYMDEAPQLVDMEYVHKRKHIIVDKKTGKGSKVKLLFGSLGGLLYKDYINAQTDGYFTYNLDPAELADLINESILIQSSISKENKLKLQSLLTDIQLDGNNILIIGKIK